MLDGRIPNGQMLKKVFDAVKEMVNDVNLECCEAGIGLQAMDASHVALVSVSLLHGAFDHYSCSEQHCLGLNMTQISKVMKLCGQNDQIIIRHNPAESNEKISFVFESPGEDRVSQFELRLMNFDTDALGIPETSFEATIVMPARQFIKVISDLSQFSDTIAIEVNPKGIRFTSRGDFGSGSTLFKASGTPGATGEDTVAIECFSEVHSVFASRYLEYFAKGAAIGQNVQLSVTANHPLQIKINLNDDPLVGSLTYFLAPKMDDAMA